MKLLTGMILTLLLADCGAVSLPTPPTAPTRTYKEKDGKPTEGPLTSDAPCSTAMWAHTYGPMKRFGEKPAPGTKDYPYYREQMKHRCVAVRGKVMSEPTAELDGDIKFYLAVDPVTYLLNYYQKDDLLNEFNRWSRDKKEQWLTVEMVCAATPRPRRSGYGLNLATLNIEPYPHPNEMSPVTDYFCEECYQACKNYKQNIGYMPIKEGDTIDVIGELITDTGAAGNPPQPKHGGREIHPVTRITKVTF